MKKLSTFVTLTCVLSITAACSDSEDSDLDMTAADFECIGDWPKVGRFHITNKLGQQAEAEEVARASDGGTFPVGTIIQLIPAEAMVKRRSGFSPETNDWEFFFLEVSETGTVILDRGTSQVKNQFDRTCIGCHSEADAKWDLVCATDHGCEALPITPEQIEEIQKSDPRC
ncbi:MAG: hypothetical protein MJE77_05420 [Proteobacteria bacterium]|nr:hypothetical protein [Pseudomonadota bacterium]